MKKVGAVIAGVFAALFILSSPAVAGTGFSLGISSPGMHFEAVSFRPSPHHERAAVHHYRPGHQRVWAPGYWRRGHEVRTAHVPPHRRYVESHRHDHHRDGYRQDRRHDRRGGRDDGRGGWQGRTSWN